MRNNLNKFQRCPGCGNFMIQNAIKNAIVQLGIDKKDLVVISGIGCSGKMSQYIDGYGVEALHGRVLPFATGVKLSNKKLTVIGVSGDGDAYGIGLSHFIHSCRRNINLLYIVCDNENYALTTGQASPTTPLDIKTKSTPSGNTIRPFEIERLAKSGGCEFTESIKSSNLQGMADLFKKGIEYDGFAHVNVSQACPTWKYW